MVRLHLPAKKHLKFLTFFNESFTKHLYRRKTSNVKTMNKFKIYRKPVTMTSLYRQNMKQMLISEGTFI